jgi:hypothetical protein
MHWGIYEFCAVLSGVVMVGVARVSKDWKPKDRVWAVLGGVALAIYGFYVAQQSSGTFVFPVAMVVIPIAIGAQALYRLYQQSTATGASSKRSGVWDFPSDPPAGSSLTPSGGADADAS